MKSIKETAAKGLEQYAAKPILVLSGSLLVLSVALNNIGFKEVVDAYAKSIVVNIEQKPSKELELKVIKQQKLINKLDNRLKEVEHLAHKSGAKH